MVECMLCKHKVIGSIPIISKPMFSASHLHNFMINDSLVDWLKLKTRPGTRFSPAYIQQNGFSSFIMNKGVEFESQLVKYINTNRIPVISVSEYITDEACQKTMTS